MTEEQIERWVEKRTDALDEMLMSGRLDQNQYDQAFQHIADEASRMYEKVKS